ncbi:hypothetical protein HYH03_008190 [Edaphochlamys debaryana]|uniref:MYND-type domain-containing protein n=1 Tax=Edaphochlamys debaryana TaxID=47281 RepID=A0A836BYC8_9CHLO|nr:hypothetical protein HYH03_008190 [Edaphochlamys debaryana]|eukprot:KAG2493676.1 hypothetical protein HYH03_008190 [Edaphochlamys debaryana]
MAVSKERLVEQLQVYQDTVNKMESNIGVSGGSSEAVLAGDQSAWLSQNADAIRTLRQFLDEVLGSVSGSPGRAADLLSLWMSGLTEAGTWAWVTGKAAAITTTTDSLVNLSPDDDTRRQQLDERLTEVLTPVHWLLEVVIGPCQACLEAAKGRPQQMLQALQAAARLWRPDFAAAVAAMTRCSEVHARISARTAFAVDILAVLLRLPQTAERGQGTAEAVQASTAELQAAASGPTGALLEGGLLQAAAGAILRCPRPVTDEAETRRFVAAELSYASWGFAAALNGIHRMLYHVKPRAAPLAGVLAQSDVGALQEALVERLCVHAGVELEPGEGGGQGRWWLPQLEAKVGHVIGTPVRGEWRARATAGWLEQSHFFAWTLVSFAEGGSGSGSSARLPRLGPRALEALCRLYRGQGLGGAYAPQPTWYLAHVLGPDIEAFLHGTRSAELAAWGMALGCELVAAELAGTSRGEQCGASLVRRGLHALHRLAWQDDCSPGKLGASSEKELAAQLVHANLAASLDYALRLAFTAADRAAASNESRMRSLAEDLAEVPPLVAEVLAAPTFPPAARLGDGGALMTFAKRAAMMTQRLQELEAAGSAEAGRQERELLAGVVNSLLLCMPKCYHLLAHAADEASSAAGISGGDAARAAPGGVEVLLERCAGALVAQAAARAAPSRVSSASATWIYYATLWALGHVTEVSTSPACPDKAQRLLACQPHRLLAAACKLLVSAKVALPTARDTAFPERSANPAELPKALATAVVQLLANLAAVPELTGRVRAWLLAPDGDDATVAEQASVQSFELGCLEPLLRMGLAPRIQQLSPGGPIGTGLQCLLRAARSRSSDRGSLQSLLQATGMNPGMEVDGFRFMARFVSSTPFLDLPSAPATMGFAEGQGSGSGPAPSEVAALVAAPLPPPLAVPLAEAVLRELRVCAYPGCLSYGGRGEAGLSLKQCSRCKCVRYCGAACQKAHWKAGHKAECQEAAAAAAGGPPT